MKIYFLLSTFLFSLSSFTQEERKWDFAISAIDSASELTIPNAKMFFGIKNVGLWEVNTGSNGVAYLSDFAPGITAKLPSYIYCYSTPPKDSSSYWLEEKVKEGTVSFDMVINDDFHFEFAKSIAFEGDKNIIKSRESVMGVIQNFKGDSLSILTLSFTFCEEAQANSQSIGLKRISLLKKEISRSYPKQEHRIKVKIQEVSPNYHLRDQIGIEINRERVLPYLPPYYLNRKDEWEKIVFLPKTDSLSTGALKTLMTIPKFMYSNPHVKIEVLMHVNMNISAQLAEKRFQKIQHIVVSTGIHNERISLKTSKIHIPLFVDTAHSHNVINENEVNFKVTSDSIPPCSSSGHPKIHFKKYSQDIFQTECDSLNHLVQLINSDSTTNYYLIGIATAKNPEEKFNAKSRAEVVKKSLVELGVNPNRLTSTQAFHKPPLQGKPKDWPFYPDWYEFEIGVYLEIDN